MAVLACGRAAGREACRTFLPDASTAKRRQCPEMRIGPAAPCGATGPMRLLPVDQAWTASSSEATFLTRLGSTWMPGPIVVETVIFLM